MKHFLFSLVLSLTVSLFSTAIAGELVPGLYGSCFEGSCGYMQVFIFVPLITLVLLWPVSAITKKLGPLPRLVLAFPLSWLFCSMVYGQFGRTVVSLIFLTLAYRAYTRHKEKNEPIRNLFIRPHTATVFSQDRK